jgi:hypothetical protein
MPLSLLRKSSAHTKSLARLLQIHKTILFPEISNKIEFMALMTRHRSPTHSPTNIGLPFFHGINCCGANNGVIKGLIEETCKAPKLRDVTNKIIDPTGSPNDHLFLESKKGGHIVDVTWQQFLLISSGLENHELSSDNPDYLNFIAHMAWLQSINEFPWIFKDHEDLLKTMKQVISMHPEAFPNPDPSFLYRPWGVRETQEQTDLHNTKSL